MISSPDILNIIMYLQNIIEIRFLSLYNKHIGFYDYYENFRTCLHTKYVRIFTHNFVVGMAKTSIFAVSNKIRRKTCEILVNTSSYFFKIKGDYYAKGYLFTQGTDRHKLL